MEDDEKKYIQDLEREQHIHDVNNEITLYQQTGDARFFWRAFLTIHEFGDPIPKNFIDKLAQFGTKILQAKTPQELSAGLELTGDEKRHIGPIQSAAYQRRWRLASEVKTVKELYKIPLSKAIATVAKNNNLGVSKVRNDYHKVFTARTKTVTQKTPVVSLTDAMKAWQ
jgi:hypothetical protein